MELEGDDQDTIEEQQKVKLVDSFLEEWRQSVGDHIREAEKVATGEGPSPEDVVLAVEDLGRALRRWALEHDFQGTLHKIELINRQRPEMIALPGPLVLMGMGEERETGKGSPADSEASSDPKVPSKSGRADQHIEQEQDQQEPFLIDAEQPFRDFAALILREKLRLTTEMLGYLGEELPPHLLQVLSVKLTALFKEVMLETLTFVLKTYCVMIVAKLSPAVVAYIKEALLGPDVPSYLEKVRPQLKVVIERAAEMLTGTACVENVSYLFQNVTAKDSVRAFVSASIVLANVVADELSKSDKPLDEAFHILSKVGIVTEGDVGRLIKVICQLLLMAMTMDLTDMDPDDFIVDVVVRIVMMYLMFRKSGGDQLTKNNHN